MSRTAKTITSASALLRRRAKARGAKRLAEFDQAARDMKLGFKIRQLREAAGLTQKQLADKIDTQPSAISRIEDADYDDHSLNTLRKVAAALNLQLVVNFVPIEQVVASSCRTPFGSRFHRT